MQNEIWRYQTSNLKHQEYTSDALSTEQILIVQRGTESVDFFVFVWLLFPKLLYHKAQVNIK